MLRIWYDGHVDVVKTILEWPGKTLSGFGVPEPLVSLILGVAVFFSFVSIAPGISVKMLSIIFGVAPIWMPVVLAVLFWKLWISYIQTLFIENLEMKLIEIRVPREIQKSPRAMELVFAGIHNVSSGDSTFINRWIEGKVRPWWSFEIVSFEGRVHFFVWMRKSLREYTETQLYAQYPGVEIFEVEDYARTLGYDTSRFDAWGCDFKLSKADVYPIKTYVDYELDKDPKEELKIDPIAHLFEYLSTLKQGEYAWMQIIVRSNKDKRKKEGTWFEEEDRWKSEAKDEIKSIRDKATPKRKDKEGNEIPGFMSLSPSDEQKIKALERSMDKVAFDTGIRGVYLSRKGAFNAARIAGLTGVFKQFSSGHLNGIAPTRYMAKFDYPWQEWFNAKDRARKKLVDAYVRRSWFYHPHKTPHFVMTSEELATIYRFPSSTVQAPGIERIMAKKAEAPSNLPI